MSEKITPQFMLWCGEVRRLFELYIDGFYECYKDHPDVIETLIKNVKEKFDDFTFGKIQILALEEPIKVDMYIDYTDEILKEILAELVEDIKLKRSIEIQRSKYEK